MKISELASLSTLATTDLFNCVDVSDTSMAATGTNKKVTPATLATFLAANGLVDTEAAVDAVAAAFAAGSHSNITVSYNDAANSISLTASGGGGGITTEDAVDAVAGALVAGANMTVTYNDPAGTITLAASGGTGGGITVEDAVDAIGAALVAGNNIDITYNDAAGTITVDVETLTKADVALSNVDNTSDANKPVSTATQTALNAKQDTATLPETIYDTVAAILAPGTNVTLDENDTTNTVTINSTGGGGGGITTEDAVDSVAAALVAGNNIDVTYNDAAGTITLDVEALSTADITGLSGLATATTIAAVNTAITDADLVTNVLGVTGIWTGNQAAYDAIGSKVSTVLYFIT